MIPSTALTNAAAQESNSGSPSIPVAAPTEPSPVGKLDAVSDNRFFNIPAIACRELMPWEISRQALPAKQAWFELIGRLRFRSDIAGGVILVPDAYQSNLASIPQIAQGIFLTNDDPRIAAGAWVHDRLYGAQGRLILEDCRRISLTRAQCDAILAYEAMPDLGATRAQSDIVYEMLRRFGDSWPNASILEHLQG